MKSVVMCGSSRFSAEIRDFSKKLKDLGVVVYEPHLYRASGGKWDEIPDFDKKFVALGLTHDHFYKIRMADVVYFLNKDGYFGNSTNMEMGYAVALNKPVYGYSEDDTEPCRKVLFSGFADKAEDLIKYLK